MKITKQQLKQIIKEELEKELDEGAWEKLKSMVTPEKKEFLPAWVTSTMAPGGREQKYDWKQIDDYGVLTWGERLARLREKGMTKEDLPPNPYLEKNQ